MINPGKFNTPILLLVFNRPDVTKKVFNRIRELRPAKLYIAADGPRKNAKGEDAKCRLVREIATNVDWDCEVKTLFRDENLGCRKSVSSAITWFFENVEEGIILEDDCLPNDSFFSFCENLLTYYRDYEQIMMISGDNFQNGKKRGNASYYFSRYAHIWGWASWRRAWNKYNTDIEELDEFIESPFFSIITNFKAEKKYWTNIFYKVKDNEIDSWAYVWHYSIWKNDGITILPNVNLVSNIGFGADATHTKQSHDILSHALTENIDEIIHPTEVRVSKKADLYTFKKNYQKTTVTNMKAVLNRLWHLSPYRVYSAIRTDVGKKTNAKPTWHSIKHGIGKDLKLYLDIHLFSGWLEMVEGVFDHFLYESLLTLRPSTEGSIVWDVGAHVGYHSMLFANMVGESGKVFSFEPNPYNQARLALHLKENKSISDRIKTFDLALSDAKDRVKFSISPDVDGSQSTGSHLDMIQAPLNESVYKQFAFEIIEVETEKGDSLVSKETASLPHIMKIDVEGAEALVLKGCTKILENKPILLIEIHNVIAMHDCLQILGKYHYQTTIIDRDSASLSRCFILAS